MATVYVVDDDATLNQALCALLRKSGYEVHSFSIPAELLAHHQTVGGPCDLIISDITMPGGLSGYDLCKRVRALSPKDRIPFILITGNDAALEKIKGIEAGADDFIQKPFQSRELLAKIESLIQIHTQDRQKTEKLGLLSRYVAPQVADLLTSDAGNALKPHRVEVTVLFADLRRFTEFSERAEPEEVLEVLSRYYTAVGNAALRHGGTLGHLAGDGVMLFFNDPEPIERHQEVAVKTALDIRSALTLEKARWDERRYGVDFGIGLAQGYATIGTIGFDRFSQYSVIGPVTNFAARLCKAADHGQILVSERFLGRMDASSCRALEVGRIQLKGIQETVTVRDIISFTDTSEQPVHLQTAG